MMNAEHLMQRSTLHCKPVFCRQRGIQRMKSSVSNNRVLNFYLLGKRVVLIACILFQINVVRAQSTPDSVKLTDTVLQKPSQKDTIVLKPIVRKSAKVSVDTMVIVYTDTLRFSAKKPSDYSHLPIAWPELLKIHPFFNFFGKPVHKRAEKYERESYDTMFYLLVLMLFYFAVVKLFFGKYLANLLTLFFRASMRQQQLREQVLQSPFPSLLLNNLFVISGGLYGAFLLRFYGFGNPDDFWIYFLYCAVLLAVLYLLKYLLIRTTGWIFNISRTAETYLFVVFMTNKIIGIFLLPFLVLISFSGPVISEIAITLSIIMTGVFYVYRFLGSYSILHKEIKISGLHFILYLCAFEIAPLLLIYKVLVTYLEKAY
jgi:Domain of unknown function (DUF4271)